MGTIPRMTAAAILAAAGLALGAAALWPGLAVNVITRVDHELTYSVARVNAAMIEGGLATEIYGAPDPAAEASSIAASLSLPSHFDQRTLALVAPGTHKNRLVLLFHAGAPDQDAACARADELAARALEGPLEVFAALCWGERAYASAHLRNSGVRGLADPAFAPAMRDFLGTLLRPQGGLEDRRGGGGGGFN